MKEHTSIRVFKETRDKLKILKKELGFANYSALFNYVSLELTKESLIPPASYEAVFEKLEKRPAIITGQSGSGKSTTVRDLLSKWSGNVFAVDVTGVDYPELEQIDLGRFFAIKWKKEGQRLRFVPNPNVEISKAEASMVFSNLNFIKNSGDLKDWVLLVDEAHRFASDPNLRFLLIEARKWARKMLLITTDWRVYDGIAKVFKPMSRPSEPAS